MQLSKTRFTSGRQCHRRLWWETHEPGAPELVPDIVRQMQFERGRMVGEAARRHLGSGVLVSGTDDVERGLRTRDALKSSPRVYEAYLQDGPFMARADVIEQSKAGLLLTEVKASTRVKPEHISDVAFQVNTACRSGVDVRRAAVMHLNRECRHPDLSNLFCVADVTKDIEDQLELVRIEAEAQVEMLGGELPPVPTEVDCKEPYSCPFVGRCQIDKPADHVAHVHRLGKKKLAQLLANGCERLQQVPANFALGAIGERQRRAALSGHVVVEPGLAAVLRRFERPLAFLDFETVMPAIPVWPGCRPYDQIPAQLSCHVETRGEFVHHQWIADGPADPRRTAAHAVIESCGGARTILAYNAPFEKGAIERLAEAVPELEADLRRIASRLEDLLPVVRDHVYHLDFAGSFSIKDVLPVLVPGEGYDDLAIADGAAASATLERLLLNSPSMPPEERAHTNRQLCEYCKRDTWGMLRLFERLMEIAPEARGS